MGYHHYLNYFICAWAGFAAGFAVAILFTIDRPERIYNSGTKETAKEEVI